MHLKNNQQHALHAYLLPKLGDVLFIAILVSIVMYGPRLFNLDGDMGRHITIGNYMLSSQNIPTRDIFSHTMDGEILVPHEWLAQIAFALAYRWMGLNGDVLLTAIIIGLTFTIKYRETIERGIPIITAAFVVMWAALASSIHWLSRPHIFTLLFIALWSYQLEKVLLKQKHNLFYFPVLMLIWANTHGAFIAGFVVWGVYFAEWLLFKFKDPFSREEGKKLIIIGISSLIVTFINPSGYLLWTTSLGYIQNSYLTSHTVEYMPPNFQDPTMWPFALMIFYGLLSLGNGMRLKFREALLMAGWMFMSLFSMRNIPIFAVITIPAFAMLLHEQSMGLKKFNLLNQRLSHIESQLKGGLWSFIAVVVIGFALQAGIRMDALRQGNQYDPKVFPINAMTWLDANPQTGNMFNHFTWGGYILFRGWPQYPVFIDGQTDFYGEALTREYESVISVSDNWWEILDKYQVDWVIIENNSPLAQVLVDQKGWKILYQDETSIILKK